MTQLDKVPFYKFLNFETSISDFEKLVYSSPDLGQQIGEDLYFELINIDFKDKNSSIQIRDLIMGNIVEKGEFETWKIKELLKDFITDIQNLPHYLSKFYDHYCGLHQENQENGPRKFRYRFLAHLGMNHFFWWDEYDLRDQYGDNLHLKDERIINDFEFYHKQLRPFGEIILEALSNGKIHINSNGTYEIEETLKEYLEPGKVVKLEHPERKNKD